MHLRRTKASWIQSAAERVADPGWRHDVLDQATDTASQLATDVAHRTSDLGSQAVERMSEMAHTVSDQARPRRHGAAGTPPRRHRLRKVALLTGAGALAAYFLDPENGRARRDRFRRRTSSTAGHLGDGLDRAAHAAHEVADVAATETAPGVAPKGRMPLTNATTPTT